MNRIHVSVAAAATAVALGGAMAVSAARPDPETLVLGGQPPAGYRDWRLISIAHEEGDLNDLRAILGNDVAIAAYRAGNVPFPDGTIIARLAWRHIPSDENNRAFGRVQSYVAGAPTNVQFMVKDSRRFSSTGGWGFAQFTNGKRDALAAQTCFACHLPAKARDFVFTSFSP